MSAQLVAGIAVEDGVLIINGKPIDRYRLLKEIGRGANGVVFEARNVALDTPCALKIWLALRAGDNRDKLQQGMAEARKMAAAHADWVAQIYDAEVISGVIFATMELIDGESLKKHLKRPLNKERLWWLARLYLNGIEKTTTETEAHGDPHPGNVLVYEYQKDKYEGGTKVKLIDFGTSLFYGPQNWRDRHWRVVEETVDRIFASFGSYREVKRNNEDRFLRISREVQSSSWDYELFKIAYWNDVLNDLKLEAFGQYW